MKLIPANEVTIETLAKIMENAFYSFEIDTDNDIFRVKIDERLFFIHLNTENHRYTFQYNFLIDSKHPNIFNHILNVCNQSNMETIYLKFACRKYESEYLFSFTTDIRYDTGFTPHQFMSNFRFFEDVCDVKLKDFANELRGYI